MRSVPAAVLSPRQAAERLGVSPQRVRRLVTAGELKTEQLPNLHGWEIPVGSLVAFEERRHAARAAADRAARNLDRLGAPLE